MEIKFYEIFMHGLCNAFGAVIGSYLATKLIQKLDHKEAPPIGFQTK